MYTFTLGKSNGNVNIYSPESSFVGHTITNLAKHQAAFIEKLSVSDIDLRGREWNFFHIGNNKESVEVVERLLVERKENSRVILHDLNLGDLWRHCENRFAKQRVNVINSQKNKVNTDSQSTEFGKKESNSQEITRRLLQSIQKPEMEFFCHYVGHSSKFVELKNEFNIKERTLPIGYHFFTEMEIGRSKNPMIFVGGTNSQTKELRKILASFVQLPNLLGARLIIAGGIVESAVPLAVDNSSIRMIPNVDNQTWEYLIRKSNLAIRLGIGTNGESSGLIRDAISCGTLTIGDESNDFIEKFPEYTVIGRKALESDLTNFMSTRLQQGIENQSQIEKPESNQDLKRYYQSLMYDEIDLRL